MQVQVLSPAPRRSKVRFAPTSFFAFGTKRRRARRSLAPPPRKKSRLLRLLPCKRGRHASAALPTFCGQGQGLFYVLFAFGVCIYHCYPKLKIGETEQCLPIFTSSLFTLPFSLHCSNHTPSLASRVGKICATHPLPPPAPRPRSYINHRRRGRGIKLLNLIEFSRGLRSHLPVRSVLDGAHWAPGPPCTPMIDSRL